MVDETAGLKAEDQAAREERGETSRAILSLLAEGRTHRQILSAHPTLSLDDIQAAAGEALRMMELGERREDRVARVRRRHAHAFEPWSDKEDVRLRFEFEAGASVAALSRAFGRPPGAIRMRLEKLGVDPRRGKAPAATEGGRHTSR